MGRICLSLDDDALKHARPLPDDVSYYTFIIRSYFITLSLFFNYSFSNKNILQHADEQSKREKIFKDYSNKPLNYLKGLKTQHR